MCNSAASVSDCTCVTLGSDVKGTARHAPQVHDPDVADLEPLRHYYTPMGFNWRSE